MPWNQVLSKFNAGALRSGSPKGPVVKNPKQAIAILISEKKAAAGGKREYAAAPEARIGSKGPRMRMTGAMGSLGASRHGGKP